MFFPFPQTDSSQGGEIMNGMLRTVESSLKKNGWLPSISKAWIAVWLLGGIVGLLVLVPVSGQSSSGALSINISASASEADGMVYSHVLIVSWKVIGGTAPYRLTIKVTGPDGVAEVEAEEVLEGTRRFELAYPDGGTALVTVEAEDGAGSTVSGMTSISLLPSLPPGENVGLLSCSKMAFSTEEDFVTYGPLPPDGNPIISDGDLLGVGCVVCARNQDLLRNFDVKEDLGLDAVDVVDALTNPVAFSTELDSSHFGQFSAGDLLVTNGAGIPNSALLFAFKLRWQDLGLDAVHFVGYPKQIIEFLDYVPKMGLDYWTRDGALQASLQEYEIDIWFSTEGSAPYPLSPAFVDGDLLSARAGIIVARNSLLLPTGVPAGIPSRGVDFGLDGVTAARLPLRETIHFSTEILYRGEPRFNDGDVLLILNGVIYTNDDLVRCFEPAASFIGLDALFIAEP